MSVNNSNNSSNYGRGDTAVYDDVQTFEHLTMNLHQHHPSSNNKSSQRQQHQHDVGVVASTADVGKNGTGHGNMSIAAHRKFLSKIRKSNKLTSIATSIAKQRGLHDADAIITNANADANASNDKPFGFETFNENMFGGDSAAAGGGGTLRHEEKKTNDAFGGIDNQYQPIASTGVGAIASARRRLQKHKQQRLQLKQQQQQQQHQQPQQDRSGVLHQLQRETNVGGEQQPQIDAIKTNVNDPWPLHTKKNDRKSNHNNDRNNDWGLQPGGGGDPFGLNTSLESHSDYDGGGDNNDDMKFSAIHLFDDDNPFSDPFVGSGSGVETQNSATINDVTQFTTPMMMYDNMFNDTLENAFISKTKVKTTKIKSTKLFSKVDRDVPQPKQKQEKQLPPIDVQASIHEQLSIIVDDVSSTPSTTVTGSIRVKPNIKKGSSTTSNSNSNHFCLTLRDGEGNIEHCEAGLGEESNSINGNGGSPCENITATLPHLALDKNDQVFRISLRKNHQATLEAPITSYTCVPRLRPMPLMLRSKVRATDLLCRVAIRVRANPGNPIVLSNSALVMVVPPDVKGENVATSREGGVWNSMTRLLSWQLGDLQPGQTIAIETKFDRIASSHNTSSVPKFPILIRCDGGAIFSGIELKGDYTDSKSHRATVKTMESSRILYRKV